MCIPFKKHSAEKERTFKLQCIALLQHLYLEWNVPLFFEGFTQGRSPLLQSKRKKDER